MLIPASTDSVQERRIDDRFPKRIGLIIDYLSARKCSTSSCPLTTNDSNSTALKRHASRERNYELWRASDESRADSRATFYGRCVVPAAATSGLRGNICQFLRRSYGPADSGCGKKDRGLN